MDDIKDPVTVLDDAQCWARLASEVVGRIVTRVGDVIEIFPVNYAVDGDSVVIRTAEGSKLSGLVISPEVLFEADAHTGVDAWSVIVRGRARVLEAAAEIAAAEQLPLKPMVPTLKRNYVRLEAVSLSGRRFAFGDEPPRDGVQPY